ncbi:M23 family metallopeptidase [Oceanobacillus halotolerans]|uniref:M23 family metallopeptidase n=1 Tax=Oceanobacillus halotolerans TaxID=2663380 RepID=UPI0013DD0E30|nr:M23 family metallopeptidase [Oceanobacillus halotolerans]
MSKGVEKVRKSISKRKKRGVQSKEGYTKYITPTFPEEEEKHGYAPIISSGSMQKKDSSSFVSGLVLKSILSVLLFLVTALLYQMDTDFLSKPKEWTSNALTEEFPFAKMNLWYKETFGSPLAFAPDRQTEASTRPLALPVSGSVTESFQVNGSGIRIAPGESVDVSVLNEGVVVFAGNDPETKKTVIVQHADGSKSTYGNLSSIDVHLYQFVGNSHKIGMFSPTAESDTVYFSIEKDNEYIDPVQVIQVDERP